MNAQRCPRNWEVEAAHDGRLQGAPHVEFMRHVAQCRACEHERMQLSRLQHALCASTPTDDVVQLRRVRQRLLAAANQRLLGEAPLRSRNALRLRTASLCALAVMTLSGLWLNRPDAWHKHTAALQLRAQHDDPEPVALRLTADNGARFQHERRGNFEYVKLYEGSLHVAFDRSQHARLSVQTPDGEIEDVGTVFHVEVQAGYTTRISVSEGAVRFRRAGQPDVMLTKGQVFERTPSNTTPAAPEAQQVAQPAHADVPAQFAPSARPLTHPRPKPLSDLSSTAEDHAYLEVLDLLHAGHEEEARAAARRYCRNYPNGLRQKELEHLARSAQP